MKRTLFCSLLALLWYTATAQTPRHGLKGEYDVDSFPTITLTWNSANPEVMDVQRFTLTEGEKELRIKVQPEFDSKKPPVSKDVLFLWEDMSSHRGQSRFAKEVLTQFFDGTHLCPTDRFNVATFNRQRNSRPQVLSLLSEKFTTNAPALRNAIKNHTESRETFYDFPLQTDLYQAINEGISMLQKEGAERAGVIVVITAGLNVKAAGASTEMETVRKRALDAGIPIYVMKFPIAGNTPEINTLAESTYGLWSSTSNTSEATSNLQRKYKQMDDRLRGQDYHIEFTTEAPRDGKPHHMALMVDKVRQPLPPYIAPEQTFEMWLGDHLLLVVAGAVLLVAGVVLAFVFGNRSKRKREQKMQDLHEQMTRQQQENERRNSELMDAMRREQQAKEDAARRERDEHERIAEEDRLARLMQTKNLYPRLQCKVGDEGFSYTVRKPRITLGRDESNDVAFTMKNGSFNNLTVSKHHAEITFNGASFEVVNVSKSYKDGIVVNGKLYQQCALRNGDMIGLGEAVITFYA